MSARTYIRIELEDEIARELPSDPALKTEVLKLGIREWRIRKALQAYCQGQATLARAAELAGISLRRMIPIAYAHGLTPKVDSAWLSEEMSFEDASHL